MKEPVYDKIIQFTPERMPVLLRLLARTRFADDDGAKKKASLFIEIVRKIRLPERFTLDPVKIGKT